MSRLISGQKVELTDIKYSLKLNISDWNWGVITQKTIAGVKIPTFLMPEESGLAVDGDQLLINVESIDSSVERVIVYAYTNILGERNREALSVDLMSNSSNEVQYDILLEKNSRSERVLNLLEIYPYKGKWKASCVCQGFMEGVERFLATYQLQSPEKQGIAVETSTRPIQPPISNGKASVEMVWEMAEESQHSPQKLYVGSQFNVISDFRIGCFYQLRNGQVGLAHSIEKDSLGSLIGVPYIEASRDDNRHFEKLDINLSYQHKLHRYLIFAYMLEGYGHWKAHNMKINVNVDGVAPTVINPDSLMVKPVYAVAMLEFDKGSTELTLLNDYFDHLPALDHAYGWNLQWREAD